MRNGVNEKNPRMDVDEVLDTILGKSSVVPKMTNRGVSGAFPIVRWIAFGVGGVLLLGVMAVTFYLSLMRAPVGFSDTVSLSIGKGMSLSEIANLLDEKNLIRSPFVFRMWSTISGGATALKAGEYNFSEPVSVLTLFSRLTRGDYRVPPIRVTIPEGEHNRQIAERLRKVLPKFNGERFVTRATSKEGYLFPDTYFFLPTATEDEIITKMEETFSRRVLPLQADITRFGRSLKEIIIMASLIEEEARTMESRQKVAGILWKRLDAGMPLQVDAVFPYILGKNTYEVTTEDLKFDSPYNTYRYAGLPQGPITNPGLDAIRATITPIATPYWYYLSDKEGTMRYAVTHNEHLANRNRYLKK